ncbi:hypothetical protein F2P79_003738 [Pimephales promelas]|nr:hypothetical protein F2P79_003738 [Pimephales promelas]
MGTLIIQTERDSIANRFPYKHLPVTESPDVRAEGRELNEVDNVTCKASDERPPGQAFEVSFAHRVCSFHRCSSRFQVHSNRAQETGIC